MPDEISTIEILVPGTQGPPGDLTPAAEAVLVDIGVVRDQAEGFRDGSEAARDLSLAYRDTALEHRDDARDARDDAQTAQGLAEGARDDAQSARDDAQSARDDAQSARDLAQDWASKAEDDPVTTDPDRFSAEHWASKAAASAAEIATSTAGGISYDDSVTDFGLAPADRNVQKAIEAVVAPQARIDVASATTTNIGAAASRYVRITGTTTIEAFDGVPAGVRRELLFDESLTIKQDPTSLVLPGATDIEANTGDIAQFISEGSGNWRCVGYISARGLPFLLKYYDSGEQTITAGGSLTLAHGLGVAPILVKATLICKTANNGYAADDEIELVGDQSQVNVTVGRGVTIVTNATNLLLRYGSNSSTFQLLNNTTGNTVAVSNADFRLRVRAFA